MLSSILYCDHVSIDWLSKLCSFKPLVFATRDSLYVFWSIFGPWLPNDWMSELGVKKWLISTTSANWLCPNLAAGCPHPHRENGLKPSQRISRLRSAKTLCVKCWKLVKIYTSNPDLYNCPCLTDLMLSHKCFKSIPTKIFILNPHCGHKYSH